MLTVISVGAGGFLGAVTRYLIAKATAGLSFSFPLGTLLSNVLAGFSIGFIIGSCENRWQLSDNVKHLLTTGLLGGLSTFSTFSMETVSLFSEKKYLLAALNVLLNLALSILGVVLGFALSRSLNLES